MPIKCVFVTSVYDRPLLTRSAILILQKAVPSHYQTRFIIYNSGNAIELNDHLEDIQNLTVLDGDSSVYWAEGVRQALDKFFELNAESELGFIFFNDDVRYDLPNLKLWMQKALLNLDENIATGSVCVDESGDITYSGFRKTLTRFHKINDYSQLKVIDALNFNLAMFPGWFIRQYYKKTFDFAHGYADIYTSNYFLQKGGAIEICDFPIGLCARNNYHDKYNRNEMYKSTIFAIFSDPKYYLTADAKKFSEIFGILKYYVFVRSFIGVIVRFVVSHIFNMFNKVARVIKGK